MHDKLPAEEIVSINAAITRLQGTMPFGTNSEKIYVAALACVDRLTSIFPDVSGGHLACAFAVNRVVEFALGHPIDDTIDTRSIYSDFTHGRGELLTADPRSAPPGSVVISPSISSGPVTRHGHVGILGESGKIYSNSSHTSTLGMFLQNYDLTSWREDLVNTRHLSMYVYAVT
jgi:hypothetical protein